MSSKTLKSYLIKTQQHLKDNFSDDDIPIEFWEFDDLDVIEEGFYFLAGELHVSDLEPESIAEGFLHLTYIFSWEMQCSSEGWDAFDNFSEIEINHLLMAYKFVGLETENLAIQKAFEAWQNNPDDEDAISKAYSSIDNKYSEDFDRIPYLVNYFIKNKSCFN
jgi:hypothetical protein